MDSVDPTLKPKDDEKSSEKIVHRRGKKNKNSVWNTNNKRDHYFDRIMASEFCVYLKIAFLYDEAETFIRF